MPSRTSAHRQDQSQSSEQRHRALLENALVGVYVNQDEKIAYANAKLAELLGYAHDALIGTPVDALIAPEHRNLVREKYGQRISGKVKVPQTAQRSVLNGRRAALPPCRMKPRLKSTDRLS